MSHTCILNAPSHQKKGLSDLFECHGLVLVLQPQALERVHYHFLFYGFDSSQVSSRSRNPMLKSRKNSTYLTYLLLCFPLT
jgi:hypothetical protein